MKNPITLGWALWCTAIMALAALGITHEWATAVAIAMGGLALAALGGAVMGVGGIEVD